MDAIRSVLIDIDGVLCVANAPIAGSIEALSQLRARGAGIRFITNTTRRTRAVIVAQMRQIGFDMAEHEVISGALAARRIIEQRALRPMLLIHPGLLPEFAGLDTSDPDAVLIGDAADGFSYAALNAAFRVLIEHPGAPLIALANNRYFRGPDGLALDAGPYVAALEYAAGVRAEVTGKPAAAIFRTALDELQCAPHDALMIGDDLESDIGGAQALGIRTALVRTGKYRVADEAHPHMRPDGVADDFARVVRDFVMPRLAPAASPRSV